MKKLFGLFVLMVLVLSPLAYATNHTGNHSSTTLDDGYEITRVKVDGILSWTQTSGVLNTPDIERGKDMFVEVFFRGTTDRDSTSLREVKDVKVDVEINGYDDDIEASTSRFDVEEGVSYRKVLRLSIPDDVDSNDFYSLHVRVSDKDGSKSVKVPLRVQEQDHSIVIRDVIFDPGLFLDAGDDLYLQVRVENMGDNRERDLRVSAKVPSLGVETASYIDDLSTQFDDDNLDNNDKDEFNSAETTDRMVLRIPKNAVSGDHDLFVEVEYDRGRQSTSERYKLTVSGAASDSNLMVSVDSPQKKVSPGRGVAYTVSLTNLGSSNTFSFDVTGVGSWGTARVDPSTLTISEDGTAEVFVFVTANDNAQTGSKQVMLRVKDDGNTVKEVPLVVNVEKGAFGSATDFRRGLEIGFAILLVILVILGIILAARKLGKDSEVEEPLLEEDQTYY